MIVQVHPLQESTIELLRALYSDKRLPPTAAIVAIGNNRYPSIEEVLDTLKRYEEVDLVMTFVQENAEVIEDAKSHIAQRKSVSRNATNTDAGLDPASPPWGNIFSLVAPSRAHPLKSISLAQIEEAFAKALHELTELKFEVKLLRADFHTDKAAHLRGTTMFDFQVDNK